MLARDIMTREVITIRKDTTIEEIARLLVENNISGAPVVDEENRVIGMVTQTDLLYKDIEPRFPAVVELLGGLIFLKGVKQYNEELKKLVATKAEDIMTKDMVTISEDTTVEEIAKIMVGKKINRIPVVTDGKLVGIVTRADMVRFLAQSL